MALRHTCAGEAALALLSCLLTCASGAVAQAPRISDTSPPLEGRKQAITGYWHSLVPYAGGKLHRTSRALEALLPKQQPWAAAVYKDGVAALDRGEYRPTSEMKCLPAELPGTGFPPSPYRIGILVEPRQVTFLTEINRQIRIVYLGRQHPAGLKPSLQGDSIAWWDGDTLVVDTIGLNDANDADMTAGVRVPMTDKMHVVERIRLVNGELEDVATFDDPGAFTSPYVVTSTFGRAEPFQEYICADNNTEGGVPTADGKETPFVLGKRR